MKCNWPKSNSSKLKVEQTAKSFLEEAGFRVLQQKDQSTTRIVGFLHDSEEHRKVVISIEDETEDYIVAFSAGEAARAISKLASITTFFGGGAIGLRSLKAREYYDKLEEGFWKHMDEMLAQKG